MAAAIVTATAVSAQESGKEVIMTVSPVQTDTDDGYKGNPDNRCGIKFNIRLYARKGLFHLHLALQPLRRLQTFLLQRWAGG